MASLIALRVRMSKTVGQSRFKNGSGPVIPLSINVKKENVFLKLNFAMAIKIVLTEKTSFIVRVEPIDMQFDGSAGPTNSPVN